MRKKWLSTFTACLALSFVFGLTACGGCSSCAGDSSTEQSSNKEVESSVIESSEEIEESAPEVSSEEVESSVIESSEEIEESTPEVSSEEVESSVIESSEEIEESSPEASSEEVESSIEDASSEEVESSTEDSSSEEENEEKTDEEIFAEIKAAVLATQNYNGAFSMKFRAENLAVGDEGYEAGYFTCNPETLELALDGTDEKYRTCEKTFEKDGKYYFCGVAGVEDEIQPEDYVCEETTANRAKAYQANYLDYYSPWALLGNYGTFAVADSYAELLEAFEIVAADSLAAMKTEEFVNTIGNFAIDLGVEDGKSWITFTTTFSCDSTPYGEKNCQSQMTYKFVVEDGYVAYIEQTYYANVDRGWGEEEDNRKEVYEYTYAFDQAFFDSIIPCEPQAKTEYLLQVNLHLPYNYIDEEYVYVTAETTKEEVLGELNDIFWNIPEDLNWEMDAWYLDEACTVKFDPDAITDLLEYERITDLYVKSISFNPNYAWVITEHQFQEHYSKPYQITKMFDFTGRGFSGSEPFHLISEPYTLPTADKVLVDGVETTAQSLTLEGGKTYVVTCIEYVKDGDFWLFA